MASCPCGVVKPLMTIWRGLCSHATQVPTNRKQVSAAVAVNGAGSRLLLCQRLSEHPHVFNFRSSMELPCAALVSWGQTNRQHKNWKVFGQTVCHSKGRPIRIVSCSPSRICRFRPPVDAVANANVWLTATMLLDIYQRIFPI